MWEIGLVAALAVAAVGAALFVLLRSLLPSRRTLAEVKLKSSLRASGVRMKQKAVSKWVVLSLDLGLSDDWCVDDAYRLELVGKSGRVVRLSLAQLVEMAGEKNVTVDWACVTGWTRHGLELWGVPLSRIMALLQGEADARYVIQTSADGYVSHCWMEDLRDDDTCLCLGQVNEETGKRELLLPREHGVIRMVAPKLFGWKSAKWLVKLEFADSIKSMGFWERLGCHERGRVEEDERWAPGRASAIWPLLIAVHDTWTACGLYFFMMNVGAKLLSLLVWIRLVPGRGKGKK